MANISNIISNWGKANDYERIKKENRILIEKMITCEWECKELAAENKLLTEYKNDIIKLEDFSMQSIKGNNPDKDDFKMKTAHGLTPLLVISSMAQTIECAYGTIKEIKNQVPARDTKTGRFIKK